ncbi:heme ABC exporter ATP-binding protein CcmA [soil metagenome]
MIRINLSKVGKKYQRQWVFRGINLDLKNSDKIAVTGYNGSGKSTFLQILAAFQTPSEGAIEFYHQEKSVLPEHWYQYISCGTPYLDLPEELSLKENIEFFQSFKKIQQGLSANEIGEIAELDQFMDKQVKFFSSGMKQRVRLALAILSDTPMLLLDEPLSNLDKNGVNWYTQMIARFAMQKTIVVCSNNQPDEIAFCTLNLDINSFKIA